MSPDTERIALDDTSQLVLWRFLVRSALIVLLALVIQEGFWQSLGFLLFVGGFTCSCAALWRQEPVNSSSLTYWDESVGHYAVFLGLRTVGQI
jgi:hypothetical protein